MPTPRASSLLALVALLPGLFAVLVTPREEEPQINVTMANVLIAFRRPARMWSPMVARPAEQVLADRRHRAHLFGRAPGMAVMTVQFRSAWRTEALVRLYDVR